MEEAWGYPERSRRARVGVSRQAKRCPNRRRRERIGMNHENRETGQWGLGVRVWQGPRQLLGSGRVKEPLQVRGTRRELSPDEAKG